MNSEQIMIAGAGVGGLTAGIALQQAGFDVTILERADQLRAVGAGITIQINAMRALERIGLAGDVRAAGETIESGSLFDRSGRPLQQLDLTRFSQEFGTPGVALHRKRLLEALAAHFDGDIRYDATVAAIEPAEDVVHVTLEDGSELPADALVGCDGLYSVVRGELFDDDELRYAGYTTWRGVATGVDVPASDVGEYWGAGERFGIVPIGFGETYWFAVADAPAGGSDGADPQAELLERFDGWPAMISTLIEATPARDIIRTDIFDRQTLDRWTVGRATLLGDAAHPMTPDLGQGAGQAIEDAVVLAEVLAQADDIEAGLQEYSAARRERANWFVERSRKMGQVAQWSNPVARAARHLLFKTTPKWVVERSFERVYGGDLAPGRGA
ncbi:MAG: FAD-dependent monooxygenase [Myxococcota bacterium]